jgi:hypothetical protein
VQEKPRPEYLPVKLPFGSNDFLYWKEVSKFESVNRIVEFEHLQN